MNGAAPPLKVGLFLTPWIEGGDGLVPRWANVLARAQMAEQAGFDSIWVSDHLLMQFGDPLASAAGKGGRRWLRSRRLCRG